MQISSHRSFSTKETENVSEPMTDEERPVEDTGAVAEAPIEEEFSEKKKKKKKKIKDKDCEAESAGGVDASGPAAEDQPLEPYTKSERDYKYDELLRRLFSQLQEKNPELGGKKKKAKVKPPVVIPEGSKKTAFVNFSEFATSMNRKREHVSSFIMTELACSSDQDSAGRLILKIKIQPKQIEKIVRNYINEYVVCSMCHSLDTELNRDPHTRLHVLKCSSCGAFRTVAPIKAGYVAQVTKRKKDA